MKKIPKIILTCFVFMNISAFANKKQDCLASGTKMTAQAIHKLCHALASLSESEQVIESLKPRLQEIDSMRPDYIQNVFPKLMANNILKNKIEKRIAQLTNSESTYCGIADINAGSNCMKNINYQERIKINNDINTYNRVAKETGGKDGRWGDLMGEISNVLKKVRSNADKALDELACGGRDYWDGCVLTSLGEGESNVEGFGEKSFSYKDEDDVKRYMGSRADGLRVSFEAIERQWQQCINRELRYALGSVIANIGFMHNNLGFLTSFNVPSCERNLDILGLSDELLRAFEIFGRTRR